MTFGEIVERVRAVAGTPLTDAQIVSIVNEVVRATGTSYNVEYDRCDHTSKDMLADYAKHGICSICVHKKNGYLLDLVKNSSVSGNALVGGLTARATIQRLISIVGDFGECKRCQTPLLQTRKHGCSDCREARSWMSRIVKGKKDRKFNG